MKKKLLIAFLSMAMLFSIMPTMSFAGEVEGTAEEPKAEAPGVEATTEIQEIESEVVAETQAVADTETDKEEPVAELTGKNFTPFKGWNGYVLNIQEDVYAEVYIYDFNDEKKVVIEHTGKTIDVSSYVEKEFKEGNDYVRVIVTADTAEPTLLSEEDLPETNVTFIKMKAKATTNVALSKDTSFTYGVDSIYGQEALGDYEYGDLGKLKTNYEFINNVLTIGKGSKEVAGNLVLRVDGVFEDKEMGSRDADEIFGIFIKETAATNGVDVSKEVWGVTGKYTYDKIINSKASLNNAESEKYLVKYLSLTPFNNDSAAFMSEIIAAHKKDTVKPTAVIEEGYEFANTREVLLKATTADQMTFAHTVTVEKTSKEKGVQTGDSNELGLWIALGLMSSVACAVFVLKRREN